MERLKNLDYRVVMLVILALASPFVSPSVALPVAIIAFSSMVGFKMYQDSIKPPDVSEEFIRDLQAIKNQMSGIMVKNATRPDEMVKEMKRFF